MISRIIRSFALAAAATVILAAAAFAADLVVSMPASIEARDGGFYLGEYATIEGSTELADAASMAFVKHSGGSFTRDDVIAALGESAVAGRSVALRMPDTVAVRREGRLTAELRAATGWKWRIEVDGPEIDDTTNFTIPARVAPGASAIMVKLPVSEARMGNKQAKLKWYQPTVYSRKPLVRGERIDPAWLAMRIETVSMQRDCVWDIASIRGCVPRQGVAAYRAISDSDIDRSSVIKNGAAITLVSMENGLGIEVAGIAMQRGAIGDVIKVRNANSRRILTGTVIGPDRVMIE